MQQFQHLRIVADQRLKLLVRTVEVINRRILLWIMHKWFDDRTGRSSGISCPISHPSIKDGKVRRLLVAVLQKMFSFLCV